MERLRAKHYPSRLAVLVKLAQLVIIGCANEAGANRLQILSNKTELKRSRWIGFKMIFFDDATNGFNIIPLRRSRNYILLQLDI